MSLFFSVTAVYPFDGNPTREFWEEYNYMMKRANGDRRYTLVKDSRYVYYIYFAEDDERFPDYLIGKLDEKSVKKLLERCPTNHYTVKWQGNYYSDLIFADGTKGLNVRAGGTFLLDVDYWTCPQCGQKMMDKDKQCKYCGTDRPQGTPQSQQASNHHHPEEPFIPTYRPWTCQVCGTVNRTHHYCGECGAKKGTNRLP
ncbi:hypothetical protein [uncultured Mitsuokella sp.]|uniref:hypothetical protein n=1 Tax=uncultured Mitsuokella sp. TaxID=453120 RepID=UPI0026707067|nr:hypothetical protein [uncultured Mitsuokella sp.]